MVRLPSIFSDFPVTFIRLKAPSKLIDHEGPNHRRSERSARGHKRWKSQGQAMPPSRELTLAEAKALAEQWEAQGEDHHEEAALQARFRTAAPAAVIRMWESGKNEDGRKLTRFELRALVERWCEVFGSLPPSETVTTVPAAATGPEPADDEMLDMHDVVRVTGLSKSTIKRRVAEGSFPEPLHLSPRRIGWPAARVRAWRDGLGEHRG